MKSLTLRRVVDNMWGTFGVLFDGDNFMCATLERKWADNQANVSCVPAGSYACKRGNWPSHGETFSVTGTEPRVGILFHKGNYQTDSMGCILIGTGFAPINGQLAITSSGDAFARFMTYLKGDDEFQLNIKGD